MLKDLSSYYMELSSNDASCFDYRDVNENTFPNLNHASNLKQYKLWALRRECRGLLLDRKTGNVLARRFHKFFNIGEMEETSIENTARDYRNRLA